MIKVISLAWNIERITILVFYNSIIHEQNQRKWEDTETHYALVFPGFLSEVNHRKVISCLSSLNKCSQRNKIPNPDSTQLINGRYEFQILSNFHIPILEKPKCYQTTTTEPGLLDSFITRFSHDFSCCIQNIISISQLLRNLLISHSHYPCLLSYPSLRE